MKTPTIRTYSDLISFSTFDERVQYLKLNGEIGKETFGFDRYINQQFYKSPKWKQIRDSVIIRDNGCDLGILGFEIYGRLYVHHMNPILSRDILEKTEILLNPEFLILVSFDTHNLIHYGNDDCLKKRFLTERKPYDTCPWKEGRYG